MAATCTVWLERRKSSQLVKAMYLCAVSSALTAVDTGTRRRRHASDTRCSTARLVIAGVGSGSASPITDQWVLKVMSE
jgi:ABC-type phosphate transport system substrate-binding protein